ncbi:adenosylcobinamide-GDP ribazoletransferase [Roseateles amylovorans]|uniref:Adenosylcobinamide-GDP ribazoletransferase n=1 Tax=Roseateles amylovorans TaxID=2978473 RepID=A0ABY6AWC4_9BURK|nr:adenosylcobinamide-GDP ribazoletransferase [Roseateles amylovorans]UXH77476.1 adenosylcobinamide-GDP ribazoletransferase [Roseateles amylovorans]
MLHHFRLFFIALQFFTRVPVPRWVGFQPGWLNESARYFPLVGAVVGGFSALVLWAASLMFPATVAVGLAMASSVWLTGGFHEDGLADSCDGLGGAVSREKSLAIMKDSRIGSYGALGLMLVLGLKAATLLGLADTDPTLVLMAVVWSHVVSRAAPVWLMHALPYAGDADHAKAKPLATQVGGGGLVVALVIALLASGVAAWLLPDEVPLLIGALVTACGLTFYLQSMLERRLGGYTGDTLGAAQQIVELGTLLALLGLAAVF